MVGVAETDPFRAELAGEESGGGFAPRGGKGQQPQINRSGQRRMNGAGSPPWKGCYSPVQRNEPVISSSWTMYSYLSRPGA